MNRRHPIDDLFRSRLEDYGQDAPMHLWDAIERNRSKKPRKRLVAIWLLPLMAVSVVALTAYLMQTPSVVSIGSFPIPMQHEKAGELVVDTSSEQGPIAENKMPVVAEISKKKNTLYTPAPSISLQIQDMEMEETFPAADLRPDLAPQQSQPVAAAEQNLSLETQKTAALLPSLSLGSVNYENKDLLKGLFPPDPKCARFSTGNWYHYVDLTLSSGFAFRNLEALDSEFENYLVQREKTEKSRNTIGAGVRLSAVSDFGLAVRAGLNYTQITEAFDYLNENEVRITIVNTYGSNGEIVRTDTTYVSGTRRIVTPNQYQILEVPLAVGYDLRKPKFDLLLSVGVRVSLLFQQKGAFLSPEDLTPVNFSSNRPDAYPAFKKRLETGWFLSAGLAYKWKPDFHLLFEPHLSYYLDSFTKPDYPISQKYWLFGASVGIRKRL